MAGLVLSLLSSAWFPLDLSAHQDALILTGNLLAGKAGQEKWDCHNIFTVRIRRAVSHSIPISCHEKLER